MAARAGRNLFVRRNLLMKIEHPLLSHKPTESRPENKRRASIRFAGICLAVGLLPLFASAQPTAKPISGPMGHYCGKLFSGGELVEVETSLQVDGSGHISGTYRFDDIGETTHGSLSELGTASGTKRMLRWFDKYGTGSLMIRFDPGYRRFEGLWGSQDADPSDTWNGGDCGAPIS